MREKFGTAIITGIMVLLGGVFAFYGVLTPRATRGLHEGAVAGTVNGEPISIREFNQALNRRMEFFKSIAGQLSDDQMRSMRASQARAVFQELAQKKLMVQEAYRDGMIAPDDEVRAAIQEIPAFRNNGRFDLATYKRLLEQNRYTAGGFERMVREDLSAQAWQSYFERRALVTDAEARADFMASHDKRDIKYVLLSPDTGSKGVKVAPGEIQAFLADPGKLNIAKAQYEARKSLNYKGKSFDQVKEEIARGLIAGDKPSEIQKVNTGLAERVEDLLSSGEKADARIDALLKPYGAQVKDLGMVARQGVMIPGAGDVGSLGTDAFASPSPINPGQGGKAKRYSTPGGGILIAWVTGVETPDLAGFPAERDKIIRRIASRKEREMMESWLQSLAKKAKIDPNPSVLGQGDES